MRPLLLARGFYQKLDAQLYSIHCISCGKNRRKCSYDAGLAKSWTPAASGCCSLRWHTLALRLRSRTRCSSTSCFASPRRAWRSWPAALLACDTMDVCNLGQVMLESLLARASPAGCMNARFKPCKSGSMYQLLMAWTDSACAQEHGAAAQGRSMEDTLALAFGDLAPRVQASESQHGAVRVTLHACMPPSGVASKRFQYTCGDAQPATVPALHGCYRAVARSLQD